MATLYISEYADLGNYMGHDAAIASEPSLAEQAFTFTTHTESSALNPKTRYVRIHTDAICSISFGTAPVATTSMKRLAANQTEYFMVPPGKSYKVSVVSNS